MFCTTLRKRPSFSTLPSTLLQQTQPKWGEHTLTTHDIAIPLPHGGKQAFFRFLLLSAAETQDTQAYMARIERLYHQTGGKQVGVVFLLPGAESMEEGTRALMELQISILPTYDLPIIPLFSLASLQTSLFAFQRQIIQTYRTRLTPTIDPLTTLLPYCSVSAPIPEHSRNVLSDIVHGIPELAQAATTRDGQEFLASYLDDAAAGNQGTAEEIIEFWSQEYVID